MIIKYTKKIIAIILILFIILWPIYNILYVKGVFENDNAKENQWEGVITLWDYPRLNIENGSRYGWISEKIKRFERENPGVYIELEPIDWSKGPYKLEVGLKTGNLPDIAPVANDFAFMREDVLETLDNHFTEDEKEEFKYQALKSVTYDNKIWGFPTMMTTYGMFINLEIFRERGVEPPIDGNWTYEEFVEKMKMLTYDGDGDGEIDHYGFTSFIKPNYYNIWGILLSDGGEIIDSSGNFSFNDEKAISGLEKVISLKNKHKVTPEDFGVLDENKAWQMFYKDKNVAVYPTGSWAVNVLESLYNNGEGFLFEVVNFPIGDSKVPLTLNNNVVSYGIFKQEDIGKLDMCVKFLKFINNEKYQRELEKLGMFTVKKTVKDMYKNNPNMKRSEDSLAYTKVIPRHKDFKEIDRILQSSIRMAIIGEKSSKDALDEADRAIEKIIK